MSAVAVPVFNGAGASFCLQSPGVAASTAANTFISLRSSASRQSKPIASDLTTTSNRYASLGAVASAAYIEALAMAWTFTSYQSATIGKCYSRSEIAGSTSRADRSASMIRYLFDLNGGWSIDSESSTQNNLALQADLKISVIKAFLSESRQKALDYMYDMVEDAYADNNISLLNELLYSAAKHLVDSSLSVSFLRATFRVKGRTEYWGYYYSIVKRTLEGRPDAERLLRGLGG